MTGEGIRISQGEPDGSGLMVHRVCSPYQTGETLIRVLLPAQLAAGRRYPVLYILPVEHGLNARDGDGLREARRLGLQEHEGGVICVSPTFSQWPFYGDHPANQGARQESHLLQVILPAVEANYPAVGEAEGRFLLGFSRSGWGAFALLLRHPDTFGRAAAWDTPFPEPAKASLAASTAAPAGTARPADVDFERLLKTQAIRLRDRPPRLVLSGHCQCTRETERAHDLLDRLFIPHKYEMVARDAHRWDSGWLAPTAALLCET